LLGQIYEVGGVVTRLAGRTGRHDPPDRLVGGFNGDRRSGFHRVEVPAAARSARPCPRQRVRRGRPPAATVPSLMGSLIKKRRKRMRKKKHKKMLKRTRFQRRAKGK